MSDKDHEAGAAAFQDQDVSRVEDEPEDDIGASPARHNISTYGADLTVESLCQMQEMGEIVVPTFQRSFIWSLKQSSRFIESILIDWPVPGIILFRYAEDDRFLLIDGQQRLKSLLFFRKGVFNPVPDHEPEKFSLTGVRPEFEGLTYADLDWKDRENLDNYLFHATVIEELNPEMNDTSIYHIFERLNTAGQPIQPQEVRTALYQGGLMDAIRELNQHPSWRKIYGSPDARRKDEELILRFLAFAFPVTEYRRPLKEYLNNFAENLRNPSQEVLNKYVGSFKQVSDLWWDALGDNTFRPAGRLNAAVFDSMTVGLARTIDLYGPPDPSEIAKAYYELIEDEEYRTATMNWTSSESAVSIRLEKATNRLAPA